MDANPAPPLPAQRWRVLALLSASRTALGFQFQTLGSVQAPLHDGLQFSYTQIGTLIGLFMLPGLALALPAGMAGRWWSDRVLVAVGMAAMAVGGVLAAVAESFALFSVARLVSGAGFVVSTLYFTKMVAEWFTGRGLATAMSVLVMSWPLGIAAGQVGHPWLADGFGWRSVFVSASLYCAAAALAVLVLYQPARPRPQGASPTSTWTLPRREWRLTILVAVAWALFNAGYIVFLSFAPRALAAWGTPLTQATLVTSLASWVMLASGALGGLVADRTGRRERVIHVGMFAATTAMFLWPQPWVGTSGAVGLSLLFGLVGAAPAGVIMSLTGQAMAPERRAFGMGVFLSIYFVIVPAAPPLAGWLFDRTQDAGAPMALAAALFAATSLAVWAFTRSR